MSAQPSTQSRAWREERWVCECRGEGTLVDTMCWYWQSVKFKCGCLKHIKVLGEKGGECAEGGGAVSNACAGWFVGFCWVWKLECLGCISIWCIQGSECVRLHVLVQSWNHGHLERCVICVCFLCLLCGFSRADIGLRELTSIPGLQDYLSIPPAYTHTHLHARTRTHIPTCLQTLTHTHTNTRMHACTHAHTLTHACTHVRMHTH
jgi:hypothetical protein